MSYVRPAIPNGSEAWCQKESETGILRRTERSMVRAMCGVQLKDIKRSMDLNKPIDQLAMAYSARWDGRMWRRKDGDVVRKVLVNSHEECWREMVYR